MSRYKYAMTKFESWILRRIARRLVIQSEEHEKNIIRYYSIINNAAKNEFTEDNYITLKSFLDECYESSFSNEVLKICKL